MRLSLPNMKQNFGKRTFLLSGAKIFNKLPVNILKSENLEASKQDISFYHEFDVLLYFRL